MDENTRSCEHCDRAFAVNPRAQHQRYCMEECRREAHNDKRRPVPWIIDCEECGESFATTKTRARFCSDGCQRANWNAKHGGRRKLVPLVCSQCGRSFEGVSWPQDAEHKRRYCSAGCEADAKRWRYRKVFECKVPWRECKRCARKFIGRFNASHCRRCVEGKRSRSRRWIAGCCIRCGDPFVGRWHSSWPCRYCSDGCAKKDSRDRRRARKRQAFIEEVWRKKVYERDNWVCQLCNEPVDRDAEVPERFAPTLDHIVPLALGGDHSYANIETAHFICNSRKSHNIEGQLAFAGMGVAPNPDSP